MRKARQWRRRNDDDDNDDDNDDDEDGDVLEYSKPRIKWSPRQGRARQQFQSSNKMTSHTSIYPFVFEITFAIMDIARLATWLCFSVVGPWNDEANEGNNVIVKACFIMAEVFFLSRSQIS